VGTVAFKYPADHYAVSCGTTAGRGGFAVDESSGDEAMMTIDECKRPAVVDNAIGKIDIVIWTCLMGELEVAEAMQPVADMIASERSCPATVDYRVLDQAAGAGSRVVQYGVDRRSRRTPTTTSRAPPRA
jgi:hypothetical protein